MPDFFANFSDKEYLLAFVAGLFFVALFAHDRLFIRVDANAEKQNRFIELLHPSKLARARMFWIALFFYFACLALVFLGLCALAGPVQVLLPIIWPSDPVGFADLETSSPAIPLIVGLLLTGFIPQFPLIKRIEQVARRLTLWIVGIPESFNDLTDALFNTELKPEILPASGKEKLEEMRAATHNLSIDEFDVDNFESSLTKVKAFRVWYGSGSSWPPRKVRRQCQSIWKDIQGRAGAVEEDLDDLLERTSDLDLNHPEELETVTKRWQALSTRAHYTADDVCALTAIFSENTAYLPERNTGTSTDGLRDFIIRARRERDQSQVQFVWALIVTLVPAMAMFVMGFLGAILGLFAEASILRLELNTFQTSVYSGLAWLVGAVITYVPAVLVGWDTRKRLDGRGEWTENLIDGDLDLIRKIMLYAKVFIPAWLVSFVGLSLFAVLYQVNTTNDPTLASSWKIGHAMLFSLAIYGMLGGIFAASLVMLFDWIELNKSFDQPLDPRRLLKLKIFTILALAFVAFVGTVIYAFANIEIHTSEAYWGAAKEIVFKMMSAAIFGVVSLLLSHALIRDYSVRKQRKLMKRQAIVAGS